jgi:hypothetical protein
MTLDDFKKLCEKNHIPVEKYSDNWYIANIKSNPYVTTIFAIANLINNLNACSGFLTSVIEPHVFITPITKNNTSNAKPIACIPP